MNRARRQPTIPPPGGQRSPAFSPRGRMPNRTALGDVDAGPASVALPSPPKVSSAEARLHDAAILCGYRGGSSPFSSMYTRPIARPAWLERSDQPWSSPKSASSTASSSGRPAACSRDASSITWTSACR